MRLARPRFTVRRMMVGVAGVGSALAYVAAVWAKFGGENDRPGLTVDFVVASALSIAFGLGSIRWPGIFFALLLLTSITALSNEHGGIHGPNALAIYANAFGPAWVIGSFAGWLARILKRPRLGMSIPDDLPRRVELPEGFEESPGIAQVVSWRDEI